MHPCADSESTCHIESWAEIRWRTCEPSAPPLGPLPVCLITCLLGYSSVCLTICLPHVFFTLRLALPVCPLPASSIFLTSCQSVVCVFVRLSAYLLDQLDHSLTLSLPHAASPTLHFCLTLRLMSNTSVQGPLVGTASDRPKKTGCCK